jgi:predicted AlkP superfamily phosphohydrolase/phosphomutase
MAIGDRRVPAGILLLLLSWSGCHDRQAAPARPGKVLLVGLDGAEWNLIRPMAAAGELPNLKRLMETGAHGNLRSLEPPAKSPAIWTTIATGKSPAEHGIGAFFTGARKLATTTDDRRVQAFWNIASRAGRTVGVVGWMVSWPAEPVNGFMVSDSVRLGRDMGRRTYPAALDREIKPLVVRPQAVSWSDMQRFLDVPLDSAAMDQEVEGLLAPIKWITATDRSFTQIAEKLYRERRPDVFAVYLRGMDSMGHHFWSYMEPEAVPGDRLSPVGRAYLKGTVRAYYRYTDELVGRILAPADDGTTVVVVSDHGFSGGPGRGVEAHGRDGVIIMAGHDVKRGEITGASVYDLTPTLLALLGIPPARDMRGEAIWSALDPAIPREDSARAVPTYETGDRGATGAPPESPLDDEQEERLRSLGYME